jgi:hypothetical protein
MEPQYRVPALTFLLGLIAWIVLLVLFMNAEELPDPPTWWMLMLSIIPGGLIAISGILCKQAGGPQIGNIIRTTVLVVFAILSWWKAGALAGIILLFAALITIVMTLLSKSAEDPDAPGGEGDEEE